MRLKQNVLLAVGIVFLGSLLGITLLPLVQQKALADSFTPSSTQQVQGATVAWVNRATMTLNISGQNITLTDGDIGDNSFNYSAKSGTSKCSLQVNVPNINNPSQVEYNIQIFPTTDVQGKCQSVTVHGNGNGGGNNFVAANPGAAAYVYNWQDSGTIVRTDGNSSWTFVDSGKSNSQGQEIFLKSSEKGQACQDTMLVDPGNATETLWVIDKNQSTGSKDDGVQLTSGQEQALGISNQTCYSFGTDGSGGQASNTSAPLGNQQNASKQSTSPAGGSGGTPAQQAIQCGVQWDNPLTWLVCPVVDAAQGLMNFVGSQINSYLEIPNKYFDTSCASSANSADCPGQALHSAWSGMRDIALAGLVIVALIMVLSQAFATGPFEAYTVRKILPRILIAIILISLSWPLVSLMVSISNGVGEGIRSLILDPFKDIGSGNPSTMLDLTGIAGGASLGVALGMIGSLSFAVAGALAIITGLMVIVLRLMIVILLAIFAPIAIICYILPGTDRIWKLWWDSFFGALLMFPMIEAIIAAGAVFSRIALLNANGSSGFTTTFDEIIAFAAAYIPFFILPATVRFAGGALRTIGGRVDSAHRGLQGGLQNFRKNERGRRAERAIHGNLYRGNSRLARSASGLAQGVMLAPRTGLNPTRWRGKMHEARSANSYEQANELMEKNQAFAGMAQDDTMLRATRALAAGDRGEATRILRSDGLNRFNTSQELANGLAQAQAVQRSGSSRAVQVATTMALAGINSGFEGRTDAAGQAITESRAMMTEIAEASGGDSVLAHQMMGRMKGMAMSAGRADEGGASYGAMSGQLNNALAAQRAGGAYDQIANTVDSDALHRDALLNNDAVSLGRGQAHSVAHIVGSTQSRLRTLDAQMRTTGLSPEEDLERGRLAAILENLHTSGQIYAAPTRVQAMQAGMDTTRQARSQAATDSASSRALGGDYDPAMGAVLPLNDPANLPHVQVPGGRGYGEQKQTRGYDPNDPRNTAGP